MKSQRILRNNGEILEFVRIRAVQDTISMAFFATPLVDIFSRWIKSFLPYLELFHELKGLFLQVNAITLESRKYSSLWNK